MTLYDLTGPDGSFSVEVVQVEGGFRVKVAGEEYLLKLRRGTGPNGFVAELSDKPVALDLLASGGGRVELAIGGERFSFQSGPTPVSGTPIPPPSIRKDLVVAPMPGKVAGALVKKGDQVRAGDPLVILESMKMEVAVRADRDGEVLDILVGEGASVKRGDGLVKIG